MLKKRELTDCYALFELMIHPDVFPFVRNKAETIEEYMFHVKNMIEEEEQGSLFFLFDHVFDMKHILFNRLRFISDKREDIRMNHQFKKCIAVGQFPFLQHGSPSLV